MKPDPVKTMDEWLVRTRKIMALNYRMIRQTNKSIARQMFKNQQSIGGVNMMFYEVVYRYEGSQWRN